MGKERSFLFLEVLVAGDLVLTCCYLRLNVLFHRIEYVKIRS